MKAKSEDIGYRGSFFRFYHVLTKTKMVVINVNTVSAKVEKYKTITVGDSNPSFASYEVVCKTKERINNAKRKVY